MSENTEVTSDLAPVKRVPNLDQIVDMNEDDLLKHTRLIRLRQVAYTLEANGGLLPMDLDEAKIVLSQLKDLDSQALKQKMIGAKAAASAADREAALAIAKMVQLMGDNPMRRALLPGETSRPTPSIRDAGGLAVLVVKDGETSTELDDSTYDDLFQQTEAQ